jgi:glucosylceramidase
MSGYIRKKIDCLMIMKKFQLLMVCILIGFMNQVKAEDIVEGGDHKEIQFWLTAPSAGINFQRQRGDFRFGTASTTDAVIQVDESQKFQTIDGFGNCLTDGSAMLLARMSQQARSAILKELFAWDENNIGISYLRLSLGASDLSESCYSYNDLPAGDSDFELKKFSLDPNRKELIPVLKEILRINPEIKVMASPWSSPAWMKTNNNFKGGSLRLECYEVYANYFVRYIQAMKAEGIDIDAITVQNEPLHPGNTPSMYMTAEDQALFVKKNLGPAFVAAGIKTKIVVYDHNADKIIYPLTILRDPDAAKYVDGSAFHLYGGKIEALSSVHNEFPGKNLYFTEQWIGSPANFPGDLAWHVKTLIIGATRNWCRNVLEWNLAADPKNDPHTVEGCDRCLGTITIDGDIVTRNPAYYILAHAAKFVRPGSVRIESNLLENLTNVAFKTGDGKIVLVVLNESQEQKRFGIGFGGKVFQVELAKGAVGTFVW